MPTHVYLQKGDLNVYGKYDPPVSDREAVRKQIERFREKDERDEFLRQRQFAIDIRKAAYASVIPESSYSDFIKSLPDTENMLYDYREYEKKGAPSIR